MIEWTDLRLAIIIVAVSRYNEFLHFQGKVRLVPKTCFFIEIFVSEGFAYTDLRSLSRNIPGFLVSKVSHDSFTMPLCRRRHDRTGENSLAVIQR